MTHVTSGLRRGPQFMFTHLRLPNLSEIPPKQAQAYGKLGGSPKAPQWCPPLSLEIFTWDIGLCTPMEELTEVDDVPM